MEVDKERSKRPLRDDPALMVKFDIMDSLVEGQGELIEKAGLFFAVGYFEYPLTMANRRSIEDTLPAAEDFRTLDGATARYVFAREIRRTILAKADSEQSVKDQIIYLEGLLSAFKELVLYGTKLFPEYNLMNLYKVPPFPGSNP